MNKAPWKLIQIKQVTRKLTKSIHLTQPVSKHQISGLNKIKTRAKFTKQVIQQAKHVINDEDLTIIKPKT